jgi:hypothetical protein
MHIAFMTYCIHSEIIWRFLGLLSVNVNLDHLAYTRILPLFPPTFDDSELSKRGLQCGRGDSAQH